MLFLKTILIFLSFLVFECSYAEENEVIATFSKTLEVSELKEIVYSSAIEPKEIFFVDGEIQGGYTLSETEDVEAAVNNLQAKHISAMQDISAELNSPADRISSVKASIEKSLSRAEKRSFDISGIRVKNDQTLQKLFSDGVVDTIKAVPKSMLRPPKKDLKYMGLSLLDFFIPTANAASYYVKQTKWVPRSGSSKTTQYLAFNIFYFPDVSGLSSFNGILTYEHETQVYNAKFADYDKYWSSNLPSAYYDTPFLDKIDIFTIGTSNASLIKRNTKYWTSMSLKPGTVSTAGVLVKGQLGHRSPSSCHSTWCIFSDMTTGRLADYDAPINTQINWTYNP